MSEVHRYLVVKMQTYAGNNISYTPHGSEIVLAEHFDRVTAERDAALRQLGTITADRDAEKLMKAKARIQRDVQTAKAADLQERQTAAGERADVLEGLLRLLAELPGVRTSGMWARVVAALKPAEGGSDEA